MRIFATLVGLAGLVSLGAALWLLVATLGFYQGGDYAPNSAAMPGYRVGHVEADGSGIFAPTVLLFLFSLFLLKFAFNLWRKP